MQISPAFWHVLSRLGEVQILLPAALFASLLVVQQPQARPLALRWLAALAMGTLITTASKLAFIGWGIGIGAINFTGVSGHAMYAAVVFPMLSGVWASKWRGSGQMLVVLLGIVAAVGVGISRVEVAAHSVSEVVAGLALGGGLSLWLFIRSGLPRPAMGLPGQLLVVMWLIFAPLYSPQSRTHQYVTRLSLMLAGTEVPHTRTEMLKKQAR